MRAGAYAVLDGQDGVASRRQLRRAGLSEAELRSDLASRTICQIHPGVYRLAGAGPTPRGALVAACLARPRAVASHQSAAWMWGLVEEPPALPVLTVRRSGGFRGLDGAVIHQVRDLSGAVATWQGIPVTRPLRTLVDLASVTSAAELDRAVDRGLMSKLVSADGLAAEVSRLRRPGRAGVAGMLRSLEERGLVGAPAPSVLESMVLRLLRRGGVIPTGMEVTEVGARGRYRLDFVLAPFLALEVDGYAYHADPRAMAADLHRMNDLQRLGWVVLRFTWFDVSRRGPWVLDQVTAAVSEHAGKAHRSLASSP